MRVALVCDWFLPRLGGIELHLRDLALALRARGVDAEVVTSTEGPCDVDGVPVHRVPTLRAPGSGVALSPRMPGRLAALLERERFDVVHAHASVVSPVAYAGAGAAAGMGLPTVLTFHSMLHRASFLLGMSERLLGWAGGRVVLTAVSSVVAAQAARWLPGANVGVLPNGVDSAFWATPRREARHTEVVIATAMRLTRKKRPAALLHAFAEASRFVAGAPALRLVMAGDGPERERLGRLAAELGVRDTVEFPGHLGRTSLRALYQRADLFVLPSERESFGIAALEARAAGLPVVAMLRSGVRDFIAQGTHGLLARDVPELARFLSRAALDEPLRRYMAARNASPPAEYDWSAVAARHLEFYAAAAALRRGSDASSQR